MQVCTRSAAIDVDIAREINGEIEILRETQADEGLDFALRQAAGIAVAAVLYTRSAAGSAAAAALVADLVRSAA